jgi:hypothetical protein
LDEKGIADLRKALIGGAKNQAEVNAAVVRLTAYVTFDPKTVGHGTTEIM